MMNWPAGADTQRDALTDRGGFRSIERFTADASHELRAPLALIITAGEVSLRRERSRDELAEVLRKIVREARHMSRLVENLLDLARGDARKRHTELAPLDLTQTLRDLIAELTPSAAAKGLTLSADFPDREMHILGEGTELRRLFLILIDNSIKYTEDGSIRLTLSADGACIKVTVTDTGIGIEDAALPHVFDRFWRADKVRSRTEGGAGLGLSLASQIVQRQPGASPSKASLAGALRSLCSCRLPSVLNFLKGFQTAFRFGVHSGLQWRRPQAARLGQVRSHW